MNSDLKDLDRADVVHALRISIVRLASTIRNSFEAQAHPDRLDVSYWKAVGEDLEVIQTLRTLLTEYEGELQR